ncbi:MAG: maleylpyruvate isomerase family mycothiol-dependent enzyme [Acidimicrobiia bacterium]
MTPWLFDPAAVRAAFSEAAGAFAHAVARVPADAWDGPGLGQWTVRDLVGHASRALSTVETYIGAGPGGGTGPVDLGHAIEYFAVLAAAYADADAVVARGRDAGRMLGPGPATAVAQLAQRVTTVVDAADDDTPVATPAGVMRLIDYLPSRVFELTVHRLDLAAATGTDDGPPEGLSAATEITAIIAAALAARGPHPGAALLALTGRRPLPPGYSVV